MIRKITADDREIYLQLAHEFYHSPAVLHPVPDTHFPRTFDAMLSGSPYMEGLIFEDDGLVAGYALLCKTYSQEAGGICVWIDELYVRPQFQCRGIGKAFFAALPELVPAARYRLEIEPDNIRAEKLYHSMGFDVLPYKQLVRDECD